MKKIPSFTIIIICFSLFVVSSNSCSVNKAHIDNELKIFFDEVKTEGCFTLLDNATGQITVYNLPMDTTRFAPGSTFDIPNTLIALQEGTITNEKIDLPYKNHLDSLIHENLTDAFHKNSIDFTNYIVTKTGNENLQKWMDSLSYGNKNIGSGDELFWSNNTLQISPDEQLGLLKRLYFDQLPFRKSAQESVRNLMLQEDNASFRLNYKTAKIVLENKESSAKNYSWMIGWIEENRHVYFFVNILKNTTADKNPEATSLKVTKNILSHYGFFKGLK